MDILTPLLLAHPQGMTVVALLVAVAEFASFIWQVSRVFRVGRSNRG